MAGCRKKKKIQQSLKINPSLCNIKLIFTFKKKTARARKRGRFVEGRIEQGVKIGAASAAAAADADVQM